MGSLLILPLLRIYLALFLRRELIYFCKFSLVLAGLFTIAITIHKVEWFGMHMVKRVIPPFYYIHIIAAY